MYMIIYISIGILPVFWVSLYEWSGLEGISYGGVAGVNYLWE